MKASLEGKATVFPRTPLGLVLDYLPTKMDLGFALPLLWVSLVFLGLLMVSRVRYTHMFSALTGRGQFFTLVWVVVAALLLLTIPALALFVVFHGYVLIGLVRAGMRRGGKDVGNAEAGA